MFDLLCIAPTEEMQPAKDGLQTSSRINVQIFGWDTCCYARYYIKAKTVNIVHNVIAIDCLFGWFMQVVTLVTLIALV